MEIYEQLIQDCQNMQLKMQLKMQLDMQLNIAISEVSALSSINDLVVWYRGDRYRLEDAMVYSN